MSLTAIIDSLSNLRESGIKKVAEFGDLLVINYCYSVFSETLIGLEVFRICSSCTIRTPLLT
jgi:hypothetical protein